MHSFFTTSAQWHALYRWWSQEMTSICGDNALSQDACLLRWHSTMQQAIRCQKRAPSLWTPALWSGGCWLCHRATIIVSSSISPHHVHIHKVFQHYIVFCCAQQRSAHNLKEQWAHGTTHAGCSIYTHGLWGGGSGVNSSLKQANKSGAGRGAQQINYLQVPQQCM